MCGINGFNWSDEKLIESMNKAVRHRGPDGEGIYVDDNVSLGHVRLAIIDLSERGKQPMSNEDGTIWITYNGEIYNFRELREELIEKGHKFRSNTDTEVVIHAYEEFGSDCVHKFNGMWAFCVYDGTKNTLFLSRDRLGIKPLYYHYEGGRFIFSSEIKGILQHNIKREPDDEIIFDYLFFNLIDHTENTFFEGIKRLLPSHNAIFDLESKKLTLSKYYDLEKRIKSSKFEEDFLRDLFLDSVEKRLVADVPVGSCLSGGIDSSSIVCAMRIADNDQNIKTFSLIFPEDEIDESKYQEIVSKEVSAERYATSFFEEDILRDMHDMIYTQEEPFPGLSMYGQYRIMKLAQENKMKVLLDGQGADEILCGYHYFFGYYFSELLRGFKIATFLRNISLYYKIHRSFLPLQHLALTVIPKFVIKFFWYMRFGYLDKNFIEKYKNRKTKDAVWDANTIKDISLLSETFSSLPLLLRFEDKNAMRFSVETRLPFCDYRLVEYILSLDSKDILQGGITKYCFRESMKDILPEEIKNRMDKIGFTTPDDEMIRTEEGKSFILKIVNSEKFRERNYWNYKKIKEMIEAHLAGKNYGAEIWKCILLEMWLEVWIDED